MLPIPLMMPPRMLSIALLALLTGCGDSGDPKPAPDHPHELSLQFTDALAELTLAEVVVELVRSIQEPDSRINGIALTLATETDSVRVLSMNSDTEEIGIDQMLVSVGPDYIALNEERMDVAGLEQRMGEYKEVADLVESTPIVVIRIQGPIKVDEFVSRLKSISSSGVEHIVFP